MYELDLAFLDYISTAIGLVGVAIIVWGAALSIIRVIAMEIKRFRGEIICRRREILRHRLGSYLLLGLEFMVAADIIHTIKRPTLKGMALLGSIVVIRTVISYFLDWEMADAESCRKGES